MDGGNSLIAVPAKFKFLIFSDVTENCLSLEHSPRESLLKDLKWTSLVRMVSDVQCVRFKFTSLWMVKIEG